MRGSESYDARQKWVPVGPLRLYIRAGNSDYSNFSGWRINVYRCVFADRMRYWLHAAIEGGFVDENSGYSFTEIPVCHAKKDFPYGVNI